MEPTWELTFEEFPMWFADRWIGVCDGVCMMNVDLIEEILIKDEQGKWLALGGWDPTFRAMSQRMYREYEDIIAEKVEELAPVDPYREWRHSQKELV